jgi:hypothetical protein
MLVRVTCAGVVIGTAQFDPPRGLAHASLWPTADYGLASHAAQTLGRQFARTQCWSPRDGDFAGAVAARWQGGRLALEDMAGREVAVNGLVILDGLPGGPGDTTVHVVADFRAGLAAVGAPVAARAGGGGRTRPAA